LGVLDEKVKAALARIWGFDSLRPLQQEVVEAALNDRDAVVVMPTGGGKSLCFQLPAVVSGRLTVVISPLIALMKDQVDSLTVVGVSAAALNSSMSAEEEADIHAKLASGELQILYMSPERLLQNSVLQMLARSDKGRGVARFAIDEAHCISAWGHDFRPEFRQLRRIKEAFPGVPVQAFTATATPKVQRDIAIQLNLERPRRFVGVFDRPNLTYRVVAKDDPVQRTVEAVRRYPNEGVIVYCLSRKDTEAIATALVAQGIPAVAYHAGLSNEARKKVSEDFAREKANIVVATIAFGMGIDRANVRCVIHECLPKSMEGYQQETGRAGRDGLPSECVLLYNHGDVVRLKRLLSDGDFETVQHHVRLLEEVRRFATSHQCRHKTLSEHFGQSYEVPADGCGACDVCLGGMKPLENGTEVAHQILRTTADLLARGRGRSFGATYLVSVLTGSRAKTVVERQGDQATGFGIYAAESTSRVSSWVHQLLDLGLLAVSEGQYPVVSMTEEGEETLVSATDVVLVENVALLEPASTKRAKSVEASVENVDEPLYEKLRAWRRNMAAEKGVPAYVIFHDATLMRVAAVRPSTVSGLRSISGVGDRRAEEFGDALITLVTEHAAEAGAPLDQPLARAAVATQPATSTPATVSAKTATYAVHFRAGLSVDEVAIKTGVKSGTVWSHLVAWVEQDRPESIDPWVDAETHAKVKAAVQAEETDFLKPVYEALGESVPYETIRLVKAFEKLTTDGSDKGTVTEQSQLELA
jgi:ATP-dependent DNA helicase RecQ